MTVNNLLFYVNRQANDVLIRVKNKSNPCNIAIQIQNRIEEAKKKEQWISHGYLDT